ncbi:MAG TPA: hypothetical protein VNP96_10855 [Solirubrobacterales bacterium]|nr:hypothetical protein [Solirubrobacterales bacterium]
MGATEADSRSIGTASSAPTASEHRARRASDIASGNSLSVAAGQVVALQRWLTRIWPGIPLLGGDAGGGSALEAGLLDSAAATVGQVLFAFASAATATGSSPLAVRPPTANDRYTDLLGAMPTDWKKIFYRIAIAVLLALLAFTVWREFRHALHPRVR